MRFHWARWKAKLRLFLNSSSDPVAWLDYDKRPVRMGVSSSVEYHTRLHSCKKEPETIDWIERTLSPGDVFYDVGANVGAYSLVAAAFWGEKVRVVAIEPSAVNYSRLVRNISLNGFERFITPLPVALGKKTELGTLHYADLTPGGALHTINHRKDFKEQEFIPQMSCPTPVYELDRLIDLFHLQQPTHLKLDVDGTELEVLQGASRTLEGVHSLLIELDSRHSQSDRIRTFVQERGFSEQSRHPYRYADKQPEFAGISNVIFTKSSAEAPVHS